MFGLGLGEFLIILLLIPIFLSFHWFAFPKHNSVRWKVVVGWFILGLLMGLGNIRMIQDDALPLPILLIAYSFGFVIAGMLWAGVYRVIGSIGIRIWKSFRKET